MLHASRETLERWARVCDVAGQHAEADRLRTEAAKADRNERKVA